jgi:EPS-associated MarR family transcriptional regulator
VLKPVINDELTYRILRILEEDPDISQRQLASSLDVSLGKVNFCLRALIDKGLIKANNFKNSTNKRRYAYLLTPKGMEEKTKATARFLKQKIQEYEALRQEIDRLRAEVKISELD